MLQVNQLKEVVGKKEAEIAVLHTTVERLEKADDTENNEKSKSGKPASKPRRRTRNEAQPQKTRKISTENGSANANAEVCLISSRFNVLCMPLH